MENNRIEKAAFQHFLTISISSFLIMLGLSLLDYSYGNNVQLPLRVLFIGGPFLVCIISGTLSFSWYIRMKKNELLA